MPQINLQIQEEDVLGRLDVFLTQAIPDVASRSFVQKLIEAGCVHVNGRSVKAHYKVAVGDRVCVDLPEAEGALTDVEPENIPLDIFYEDAWLLVVHKPAGMLVHPAPGFHKGTLVNALRYYCQSLSDMNASFRPGIVHRLDRETSGLMLVAKDNRTHVRLTRQFQQHLIRKQYGALVKGHIAFDEGIIEAPLGRHPRHFDKRGVSFAESAKEARTGYQVVERRKNGTTLVRLFPESGRMHQLRVHMAYLGHPILGDDKYGEKHSFGRLALHAQAIELKHPITGNFLEFHSPLPREFFAA